MLNYLDYVFRKYTLRKNSDFNDEGEEDFFSQNNSVVRSMLADGYSMDAIDEESIEEYIQGQQGDIVDTFHNAVAETPNMKNHEFRKELKELMNLLKDPSLAEYSGGFEDVNRFINKVGGVDGLSGDDLDMIQQKFLERNINIGKLSELFNARKRTSDILRGVEEEKVNFDSARPQLEEDLRVTRRADVRHRTGAEPGTVKLPGHVPQPGESVDDEDYGAYNQTVSNEYDRYKKKKDIHD